MNPQRWQRIDELLSAVLERDSGERASFLQKQCEGDDALRHEVESLLEAHDEADDFLEAPLFKTLPDDAPRPDHRMRDCESCRHVLPSLGYSLASPDAPTVSDLSGGEGWPEPPLFAPGERIGRYVVERLVGEGGMGTVYAARDPELGRVVALKLLRVRASGSEDSAGLRSRLLREAQAMALLAHPNVVTVFEVGTLGEQVFLAMELVEGGTLTRWLAERTRPWEEVLKVFLEAGRGLAAAHAAGLVHRDFKPDNVLVGADGRVRVMDFGLARTSTATLEGASAAADEPSASPTSSGLTASLTRTGALLGTPAYMAPEQMRGEPVNARADLFSFCSSVYEALYGQRAFQADSLAKLRLKIEGNEVSAAPPGRPIPTWLRRELLRGLRANPTERHETIDELLAALSKGKERPSVRKSLIAAGAIAILAAVLVVAGSRFGARSPQSPANAVKAAPARRAVAILALRSLSGHPGKAWLSSAVTEMLSTELGSGRQLRVIPGENVAVAVRELGLAGANLPEPQALRKIGANLGADLLLSGSVTVLDAAQRLRVDLHLEDARTGEALANAAEVGEQDKLFELVTRLGARLRRELGLSVAEPDPAAHASFPANAEAARL
ncbi:MAG TPA: serine/threonine-protein kinase, partial [Myxococcaceae bacterium]|nr:serine/threonine-protein kinase [Myxococcaceae bacterium]